VADAAYKQCLDGVSQNMMTTSGGKIMTHSTKKPITAIVVGAGHRGMLYASYALTHPEELEIVGVVEPDDVRRKRAAKAHDLPASHCFRTLDEWAASHVKADAAINGTMDQWHVPTTLKLLEAGLHVLLEKPIGVS